MNRIISLIMISVSLVIIQSCDLDKPFPGETGKIKNYTFNDTTTNIINQLDRLLLNNEDYKVTFGNGFDRVYIEFLPTQDKFGLEIFKNYIKLIVAGEKGNQTKIDYYLDRDEKKRLTESFEKNVINRALLTTTSNNEYIKPFSSSSHGFFVTDTLLKYPFPPEFDTLSLDYFKNLIESFDDSLKIKPAVHFANKPIVKKPVVSQYCNLFSINERISGYLSDSIYVTRLYRQIGHPFPNRILFNDSNWISFVKLENTKNRILSYNQIRKDLTNKGYPPTSVYMNYCKDDWMNDKEILNCKN